MKYFIIAGPTASGKTALVDLLLQNNQDFLEPVISFTTRKPRPGESFGKDYYFITTSDYLELQKKIEIVEQVKYLDHEYGVTRHELQRVAETRKNGIAIMNLDGVRALKHSVGYQNVISIFIYRDLSEIFKTINTLNLHPLEASRRLEMAKQEMRDITSCDHVVYNITSIGEAAQQMLNIIKTEINSQPIEKDIKPGQKYRHFTGEVFEIVCGLAEHTETLGPIVIYRSVKTGKLYARPYEIFCGKKVWPPVRGKEMNRYELIEE